MYFGFLEWVVSTNQIISLQTYQRLLLLHKYFPIALLLLIFFLLLLSNWICFTQTSPFPTQDFPVPKIGFPHFNFLSIDVISQVKISNRIVDVGVLFCPFIGSREDLLESCEMNDENRRWSVDGEGEVMIGDRVALDVRVE